ncbi:cytochrome P450 [Streptomyces sp. NPDC050610]|uniref:cytochrome P450 n=1 Tax=Streptomyces sp. NPDC050610 TaxID=3157097 RepID=UPI00341CEFB0
MTHDQRTAHHGGQTTTAHFAPEEYRPSRDADNPLSPAFWERQPHDRNPVFARLRAMDTPPFLRRPASGTWQMDDGFYALTRYDDVVAAGRNTEAFSSEPTALTLDSTPPQMRQDEASLINMDNPRHARLRKIVARAFTRKSINRLEAEMRATAGHIMDDLLNRGPCDFVQHAAGRLPLEIICSMTGIPRSARADALRAVDTLQRFNEIDSRLDPYELTEALATFRTLMSDLVHERRTHPTEDLVSALVTGLPGEETLNETEVASFFLTLVGGGNETVRNTFSQALVLLTENPEQRRLLLGDLPARLPSAVEELIRHTSPAAWTRRNVIRPVQLRQHTFQPGDKVILYFASANMDESAFNAPEKFDILREPNPHVGFGTPNPHYCIGAHLARRELTALLTELLTRIPDIRATAPPTRQSRGVIQDITYLPCAWGSAR